MSGGFKASQREPGLTAKRCTDMKQNATRAWDDTERERHTHTCTQRDGQTQTDAQKQTGLFRTAQVLGVEAVFATSAPEFATVRNRSQPSAVRQ